MFLVSIVVLNHLSKFRKYFLCFCCAHEELNAFIVKADRINAKYDTDTCVVCHVVV